MSRAAGGRCEDRRLKALEEENARLKKLLAEQMLDNAILKDVASKNGDPDAKRKAVAHACEAPLPISVGRAKP